LQSLDQLEPADKQEIRLRLRARAWVLPVLVGTVNKVWQVCHRLRKTALGMHPRSKAAGRDKLVHMSRHALKQTRIAPELRRLFRLPAAFVVDRLQAVGGEGVGLHQAVGHQLGDRIDSRAGEG
jgi:hypothetical protein